MGATRTMESKRPVFEIPVQYETAQARDVEPTQEQDSTDLMPAQEQNSTTEETQLPLNVIHRKRQAVPIQEKALLTIEEAAEYTGIGLHKLRELSNSKSCTFILWNGSKRMFKRRKLEEYLINAYSI